MPTGSGSKLPPAKIEDIHVGGVWTRAARKGEKTHIFMTIENKGPVPVRLRGGETDIAKYIQLVRFRMQGAYMLTRMVSPASSAWNCANCTRTCAAAKSCR